MWLRRRQEISFDDQRDGAAYQFTCAEHAPDCALGRWRSARAADPHRALGAAVVAARGDRSPAGVT